MNEIPVVDFEEGRILSSARPSGENKTKHTVLLSNTVPQCYWTFPNVKSGLMA